MFLVRELLLGIAGQRKIHVVAAQQQMFADGNALQLQFATLFGDGDQVKSVVPPPISTTRIRSPGLTCSRQFGLRSIQA